MTRHIPRTAAFAFAFVTATAWAGPREDLHDAFAKFLHAHSFRATVTDVKDGSVVSSMEFVAPDRYRVKPAKAPQTLIVGDTMYIDMGGRMTAVPVPGVARMVGQYRNGEMLSEFESGMTVQAVGEDTVDGAPARVYAYTVTKPMDAKAKAWISVATGLPIQIESTGTAMGRTSTTRIRYTDFDDASIRIEKP
jgi:hypothetical protein